MSLIYEFVKKTTETKKSIIIVGDSIIDEYYNVEATRISPEFPIPVMLSKSSRPSINLPGGAANVANQLKHWNVSINLFSFADEEAYGTLGSSLDIPLSNIELIKGLIPRKRRIYDGSHPAFRWDIEPKNFGLSLEQLGVHQQNLQEKFSLWSQNNEIDAMIISDYDKGVFCTETFLGINSRKKWINPNYTTVVDPKNQPISGWHGCTIFKPNTKESQDLSNLKNIESQHRYFLDTLNCDYVVATQGENGIVGTGQSSNFTINAQRKINVKSVIGAGDCFAAFLTLAYSLGFSIKEAAQIAFEAGQCYVKKEHNDPITPHELLANTLDPVNTKLLHPPQTRNYVLGFTNGCFDLLHVGHLELLKQSKLHCDKLVVGINTDESISKLKGSNRPIINLNQRIQMLSHLPYVDFIIPFSEDTPLNLIKKIKPDVLFKGKDYNIEEIIGHDIVPKIILCDLVKETSTTIIESKIKGSSIK